MDTKRTTSELTHQVSKSYKLISDAAGLMSRCAGYMSDREVEQDGWKLFYAVDVDIIKMYMAPDKSSKTAMIFDEGEDAATHALLARLISDFIFQHLKSATDTGEQESGCLFIIPPHDEELGRVIFALSNELVGSLDEAEVQLENVLADLPERQASGDHVGLSQWLIDSAPMLVEIFDGKSGPRSELERFEALDEHRLLHIERYKEASGLWTFPLPLLKDKPEDFQSFTESYETWKERLLKHKSSNQPKHSVIRDAYVMTMIEWLNKHMEAEKRRIVLITGTRGILNASSNYCLPTTKGPSKSFADMFVRHPHAFMADNEFFPEVSTQTGDRCINKFSLFDWLNLFFPKVIREGVKQTATVDRTLLKRIEEGADQNFQEAIMLLAKSERSSSERDSFPFSMLDEWRTQVRSACISRKISVEEEKWPERAKNMVTWLKSKLDQGSTVEQLRSDLANRAIQSLSALYSSTVWLGLWSQVGTIKEQVRGIPALRFDACYQPAQSYCSLVISAMQFGAGSNKSDQPQYIDIADMYSELSRIDGSNYHGHVIHALAYATKGHWHAAKTLCKIALRTADELPEDKKNTLTGRESAYLLAISERRLARKLDDLLVAQQYLQEAKSRKNHGESDDIRFSSEAIAIDVAKINFEYFTSEDGLSIPTEFDRIWKDASELFSQLESEPLPEIKAWIYQQLSTNTLNLALIFYDVTHYLSDAALEQVRKVVLDWERKSLDQESIELNDIVSDFIFLVATVVFFDGARKTKAHEKIKNFSFYPSLPFDKVREVVFRQLVEQACTD